MTATQEHRPHEHPDHIHGEGCGHETVQHGDHVDYLHEDHRHAEHEGHYDEHGDHRRRPVVAAKPSLGRPQLSPPRIPRRRPVGRATIRSYRRQPRAVLSRALFSLAAVPA